MYMGVFIVEILAIGSPSCLISHEPEKIEIQSKVYLKNYTFSKHCIWKKIGEPFKKMYYLKIMHLNRDFPMETFQNFGA